MSIQQKINYNITDVPKPGKYNVINPDYDANTLNNISLPKASISKIVLIGDSNVGKTCLAAGIVSGEFHDNYQPTIGVQFIKCDMFFNGTKLACQIWDLAGQVDYSSVNMQYCRGADIVLFCFSLIDKSSFLHIDNWKAKILDSTRNCAAFFLVGCKSDLDQEISEDDIKNYCEQNKMEYFQTSAKRKFNTIDLMKRVGFYAAYHVQKKRIDMIPPKITISDQAPEPEETHKQKKKCCS